MATEYLEFEGKAQYAQVYETDNAFGASNWKINLFPKDDAEMKRITAAGIQKKIQENNDPAKGPIGKYIQFTRPLVKIMNTKEGQKVVNFSGPVVTDHDDNVIVDYVDTTTEKRIYSFGNEKKNDVVRRGKPVIIGNSSDVKLVVAVYDTQKGKGQRLESVKILNLVPYVRMERELPPVLEDVRTPMAPSEEPTQTTEETTPW